MSKPVLSDPIALRLPVEILKDIETIAAATERTRSWVIVRALKYYLAAEGKDILEIAKGFEDVRQGRVVDAEALFADLDRQAEDDAA
jgi:predicted transcriptional regulator